MSSITRIMEESLRDRLLFLESSSAKKELSSKNCEDQWIDIGTLLGINQCQLPSVDALDLNSAKQLNKLILDLWKSYNLDVDLPINELNSKMLYETLVSKWEQPVPVDRSNVWIIEVCTFNHPESCVMGEQCGFCSSLIDEVPPSTKNFIHEQK